MKAIAVLVVLMFSATLFSADVQSGWPEENPILRGMVEGRAVPQLSAEAAIATARKAVVQQKSKLNNRFLASVKYVGDRKMVPDFMKEFADGPFWLISYEDPEYREDTRAAHAPISVLVFSTARVAILGRE